VLENINPALSQDIEKECQNFFGQSRVMQYDSNKLAYFYLPKYYNTNFVLDFDYLKINSRFRMMKKPVLIRAIKAKRGLENLSKPVIKDYI